MYQHSVDAIGVNRHNRRQ